MFEQAELQPDKRIGAESGDVARDIVGSDRYVRPGQGARRRGDALGQCLFGQRTDRRFVVFQEFAVGPVELDAVIILGNVAAGDDDGGHAPRERRRCDGRCRQHPAPMRHLPMCGNCRIHACGNVRARRPQIAADEHFGAAGNADMVEESEDIGRDGRRIERGGRGAKAGCSEGERHGRSWSAFD